MRLFAAAALAVALFGTAVPAHALPFFCISGSAGNCATGEAQLRVDVFDAGSGMVKFQFTNTGSNPSSISDIYFDDGTLLGISSVTNGPGVAFTAWSTTSGVEPSNLPGGNLITPPFMTTKGFSADSDGPNQIANGVNPGEWVDIVFNLINGRTFADTLAALESGELRIGLRVTGFAGGECSGELHCGPEASFVNHLPSHGVPEPPVLALFGVAMVAAGLVLGRRGL